MTDAPGLARHPGTDLVTVDVPARRPPSSAGEAGALVDGVALVTLNRPRALNALSFALLTDLVRVVDALDADPERPPRWEGRPHSPAPPHPTRPRKERPG